MTTVVDIYGTLTNSFAGYDSDNPSGYKKDDLIVRDGKIYIATTDIPAGTVFNEADSELRAEAWFTQLSGTEAATLESLIDVSLFDSDNGVYSLQPGMAIVWDSDTNTWRPGNAGGAEFMEQIGDVSYLDSDNGVSILTNGKALVWDSDTSTWRPGEAGGTTINTLSDVGDVDSDLAPTHGQILAWDSERQVWDAVDDTIINDSDFKLRFDSEFKLKSISDLIDVDTVSSTPTHGQTIVWNSISGVWQPGQIATTAGEGAVGATLRKDTFTYTGTNAFILAYEPFGEISGFRNGVSTPAGSFYADSDGTGMDSDSDYTWIAVYVPSANDSDELVVGDRIDIQYIFNDAAAIGISFGMLTDIDFSTTQPKHHQQLIYDSDAETWLPARAKHVDRFYYSEAGQTEFILGHLATDVTGFYRNGMRLINSAWNTWDSDVTVVNYVYENNGYSLMADSDEIQITYNTITE